MQICFKMCFGKVNSLVLKMNKKVKYYILHLKGVFSEVSAGGQFINVTYLYGLWSTLLMCASQTKNKELCLGNEAGTI